jgi:hypothetical protein
MRPAVDGNPTSQRGHGRTPGRGAEQTTGEADQYAWQHQHQHQHQAQTPMPQFAHPMTYAGHHHQAPCAPPTHAHQPFHPLATDPQPYHPQLHHPPLPPQLSFAYQQYSAPASAPGPSPFTALPESHYYHGQRHDQREGEAPTVGGRAAAQGPVQLCCHQVSTRAQTARAMRPVLAVCSRISCFS